ncbi:MAG: prolyl oligopeptidase family serine peptidase [Candidatus Tyrphobacter sp.]
MTLRTIVPSVLCACLCTAATAAAQARAFTLDDYANIVSVGSPQISPDGRQVLITVGRPDMTADRMKEELVLVDVASGDKRTLTFDRPAFAEARWMPDGRGISFIAPYGNGDDARAQVWIMPMGGGDARVVTKSRNGVELYAFRRDGRVVAYFSTETPPNQAAIEHHEDYVEVGNDPFSTQRNALTKQLWIQDVHGGEPEQLTSGASSIYPDTLSWSSDGRYIAFDRIPDGRFDSIYYSRTAVYDFEAHSVRIVDDRWGLGAQFEPSGGDRLAYTAGTPELLQNDLDVISVNGGTPRNVAPSLDRNVQFFAWTPGGGFIAGGDDHVSSALWRVAPDGAVRRVDLGNMNFGSATASSDGAIAFTADSSVHPSELYYLAPHSDAPRRLTDYNAPIASLDLAPSREIAWRNDGFEEDGVITYPLNYRAGTKYPLVLDIHGGPIDGASTTSFSELVQLLAAHGYIVLQPNYRGSDNLGRRYAHAIIGDNPIAGVGHDCVAGIQAVEATGAVDASRIGVSGWSAGGWTTSWLITHYDLFKAAVSGAAVDDTVLQYSISQINSLMPELFGGKTPWATPGGLELYRDASPITYVQNVRAATLILSDTTDPRVPTPESYEFYTALHDLGKTVAFDAIPAYGHHPSDPVRNRLIDRLWLDWMVKYLSP